MKTPPGPFSSSSSSKKKAQMARVVNVSCLIYCCSSLLFLVLHVPVVASADFLDITHVGISLSTIIKGLLFSSSPTLSSVTASSFSSGGSAQVEGQVLSATPEEEEAASVEDRSVCENGNAEQCVMMLQENSNSSSSLESEALTSSSSSSTSDPAADVCEDISENCDERSQDDGCITDFASMKSDCRATCLLCSNNSTSSNTNNATDYRQIKNMYSDQPQLIAASDNVQAMHDYVRRVNEYMYGKVYADTENKRQQFSLQDQIACKNRNAHCTHWAHSRGECHVNPEYMKLDCAPACFSCDELQYRSRCMREPVAGDAWTQPGDLNSMFERIVADPEYASKVQVLSRPRPQNNTTRPETDLPDGGPWLLVLDDFLTAEECEAMIQLGQQRGFTRSMDQSPDVQAAGNLKAGVTQHRTSSTAWCDMGACAHDDVTKTITQKMQRLTNISQEHAEYLQLLRYDVGQAYGYHHDYTSDHLLRRQGPRILTIFAYLNDVETGGGTRFSLLNLTVTPKQGRVLVWPSVLDESPKKVDSRTAHEALVVEKGVKYGANAWIHLRDFKTPFANNCS